MLELLTYEPFGKFLPEEETHIREILSGNYNPPQAMLHALFSGFYNYYVQNGNSKNISWLQRWKDKYHQNENYTHSTKSGRVYYPLLFKKICFYIIVRKKFSDKEFMTQIGLSVNRISKWGISPQFRRFAEADTYSVIRSYRSGVKRKYLVSQIKKLYYEGGRQVRKSTTLKELPTFVDVFAGTASVAASVVTDGCPPPIVNDYDPVMVCFAWAFTFYQREIRKEIVEFHDYLRKDLKIEDCSYDITAYERHKDKGNVFTDPEASDNPSPRTQWLWAVYKYSEKYIKKRKRFAQRHQELIMRFRSGYKGVNWVLKQCNRSSLRNVEFNSLSKHMPAPKNDPDEFY